MLYVAVAMSIKVFKDVIFSRGLPLLSPSLISAMLIFSQSLNNTIGTPAWVV